MSQCTVIAEKGMAVSAMPLSRLRPAAFPIW